MNLVIISSDQLRHRYFISQLAANFQVTGLLTEAKKRDPSTKGAGTDLAPAVQNYFAERDKSEREFFGVVDWAQTLKQIGRQLEVPAGEINQPTCLEFIRQSEPDYLAVFGSSILKPELINLVPAQRIINMHLGLSPYYRGSGTNFWPLYDEQPEYVGVTIHYLDAGIDSGRIITQGRPAIVLGDTPHSIGNKTIKIGVSLMVETIKRLGRGGHLPGVAQDLSKGKLCLFKDCEARHLVELEEKFKSGLVQRYLERMRSHSTHVDIVV